MTNEELLEAVAEAARRNLHFPLRHVPGHALAREFVNRRKSRPTGRPPHPMRDRILAERAAGARIADLARRYRTSPSQVGRIVLDEL